MTKEQLEVALSGASVTVEVAHALFGKELPVLLGDVTPESAPERLLQSGLTLAHLNSLKLGAINTRDILKQHKFYNSWKVAVRERPEVPSSLENFVNEKGLNLDTVVMIFRHEWGRKSDWKKQCLTRPKDAIEVDGCFLHKNYFDGKGFIRRGSAQSGEQNSYDVIGETSDGFNSEAPFDLEMTLCNVCYSNYKIESKWFFKFLEEMKLPLAIRLTEDYKAAGRARLKESRAPRVKEQKANILRPNVTDGLEAMRREWDGYLHDNGWEIQKDNITSHVRLHGGNGKVYIYSFYSDKSYADWAVSFPVKNDDYEAAVQQSRAAVPGEMERKRQRLMKKLL